LYFILFSILFYLLNTAFSFFQQVGDRVGVMRMADNSLHFFINGVDVGKKIKTIPPVLYGVVDVFGQAEEVTITGMGVDYFSSSEV